MVSKTLHLLTPKMTAGAGCGRLIPLLDCQEFVTTLGKYDKRERESVGSPTKNKYPGVLLSFSARP